MSTAPCDRAAGVRAATAPALAAAAGCAALGLVPPAAASPWLLQPSLSMSTDWRSNAAFAEDREVFQTQAGIVVSLPAAWQEGRWSAQLSPNVQFRAGRGVSDTATRDLGLSLGLARGGERLEAAFDAGYAESSLLGPNAPAVGLDRADGTQRSLQGGVRLTLRPSVRDSLAVGATHSRQGFDGAGAELVGTDQTRLTLSYSRALTPRLNLLFSAARSSFEPGGGAASAARPGSSSVSLQGGFGWQPTELWSVQATAGRSRLRSGQRGGQDVAAADYALGIARKTSVGALSLNLSQSFQASAFGVATRQRRAGLAFSAPLAPRVSFSVGAAVADDEDAFAGFTLATQRNYSASGSLGYALTERWSLTLGASWTRIELPATVLRAAVPAADSRSLSVGLGRSFGAVPIFR